LQVPPVQKQMESPYFDVSVSMVTDPTVECWWIPPCFQLLSPPLHNLILACLVAVRSSGQLQSALPLPHQQH
jgi:hypothetical protein